MRSTADPDVEEALDGLFGEQFLQLGLWGQQRTFLRFARTQRSALIAEGDSVIPEILAQFPRTDRQHLRKLVRQARNEHETRQPPRAARQLFRYLREQQELQEQPDY